jgi:hypothetical protein
MEVIALFLDASTKLTDASTFLRRLTSSSVGTSVRNWREQPHPSAAWTDPLPVLESQRSMLCAVWFTFQINLTEVLKDPATLLKE